MKAVLVALVASAFGLGGFASSCALTGGDDLPPGTVDYATDITIGGEGSVVTLTLSKEDSVGRP